jgi:hypothetical protein
MTRFCAVLLTAAGALLIAGCGSTQTTDAQPTATTLGGPTQIGAGDSIGWSLHNADKALASHNGGSSGSDYASHP